MISVIVLRHVLGNNIMTMLVEVALLAQEMLELAQLMVL